MTQTLRDRQIVSLEKMLLMNKVQDELDLTSSSNKEEITWKVLVLDSKSTSIVSSVLRVNDLLHSGVTIHTLIKAKRSALPDVPVVYFVQPTAENINLIVEDLKADMYSEFYINFTSSLPRDLLEEFARNVSLTGKSAKIQQVYDQYLDFIVTEKDLFSLEIPKVFSQFNSPSAQEEDINALADTIATGIFDTVLTMGSIPVIRAQKAGPAEIVAAKLDAKLRDYVINTKYVSSGAPRFVLILLDRNIDLASMFGHSWIYQCLVFDVFNLAKNTIKMPEKTLDLDPKDFFWQQNAHLPFPEAVENVEEELAEYKRAAEEITRKTGVTSLEDLDPNGGEDTLKIQQAVNQLPELTARKGVIDMHMNVLAALVKELDTKSLDGYYELEQTFANDVKGKASFMDLLNDGKDTLEDKLRTYIILYLKFDLDSDFVQQVEGFFSKQENFDSSSLQYIHKIKETTKMSSMTENKSLSSSHVVSNSFSSKLYGLAEGRIQGGVSLIKTFLEEKKTIPITNIVEAIMDPINASPKNVTQTDDYLYFDPQIVRGVHSKPPQRSSYNESVVFVVGGGNYLEYTNLQDWAKDKKRVIYGSTQVVTPHDFLAEISN